MEGMGAVSRNAFQSTNNARERSGVDPEITRPHQKAGWNDVRIELSKPAEHLSPASFQPVVNQCFAVPHLQLENTSDRRQAEKFG